ncbi:MAG: GMP synthase [Pseudomonadota bacterium]
MHIGILQADHVLEQFQPEFGNYPDMFQRVFNEVDSAVQFTTYDVTVAVPSDMVCDAYLITGSRHSVYDDLPWIPPLVDYLRTALQAGKKVVGICFGHQLIAHFFGGETGPAEVGWGVGVREAQILRRETWMEGANADCIATLCSHKDQVLKLPGQARTFAGSEFCPIAGFTIADQVITWQGHPEFQAGYSQALLNYRRELLGEEVYGAGVASLSAPTSEHQVVRWILNFLSGQSVEAQQ